MEGRQQETSLPLFLSKELSWQFANIQEMQAMIFYILGRWFGRSLVQVNKELVSAKISFAQKLRKFSNSHLRFVKTILFINFAILTGSIIFLILCLLRPSPPLAQALFIAYQEKFQALPSNHHLVLALKYTCEDKYLINLCWHKAINLEQLVKRKLTPEIVCKTRWLTSALW